jgi:hypothetical protein
MAGGGGRDTGLRREHAGRERPPVAEREQHLGARRLGEHGADGGEIGVRDHGSILFADASISVEVSPWHPRPAITCCIQYVLDPHELPAFEDSLALIEFPSLAEYEVYRQRLAADPDAQRNVADARASRCILVESRSFLRRS